MSDRLSTLNRFWAVEIIPYNRNWRHSDHNSYIDVDVHMRANLTHRDHIDKGWEALPELRRTQRVRCPLATRSPSGQGACSSFSVVFERKIRHLYSALEVKFDLSGAAGVALGDVGVQTVTGARAYAQFEISYTVLFTAASIAAVVIYIVAMAKSFKSGTATFEQVFALVLGVGVVFYDNPFFSIEYICGSITTFNIIDTLSKNAFISLVLAFWLLSAEKFASVKAETGAAKNTFLNFSDPAHVAKLALVAAYFVLAFITSAWTSVREKNDPVHGSSISYPGVLTFYILTVVVIVAVIAWTLFMAVQAIPYVTSSQMVFTRFLFYAIPSFVVAVSLFIGSISGSFGGITRSPMEIAFFTALYNTYVYILIYGYWPSGFSFGFKNAVNANDEDGDDDEESKTFSSITDEQLSENSAIISK